MGARPLRRAIQRYIEDPLADFVLGRELEPGLDDPRRPQARRRRGRHHRHPGRRHAGEGHRPAGGAGGRRRDSGDDKRRREAPSGPPLSSGAVPPRSLRRCRRLLHDRRWPRSRRGALASRSRGSSSALSHVSPSTGAFYRCAWALPALCADHGLRGPALRAAAAQGTRARLRCAGVFFALDLVVLAPGDRAGRRRPRDGARQHAGRLVGLLAWLVLARAAVDRSLAAIPVALFGVRADLGRVRARRLRRNPGLGVAYGVLTALAYSGFLLVLRASNRDMRRPAGPLFDATLASALGLHADRARLGDLDLTPVWPRAGLADRARAELAGARLAADLDLAAAAARRDDVGALDVPARADGALRRAILGESPSPLQLGGVALSRRAADRHLGEPAAAAVGRAGLRRLSRRSAQSASATRP